MTFPGFCLKFLANTSAMTITSLRPVIVVDQRQQLRRWQRVAVSDGVQNLADVGLQLRVPRRVPAANEDHQMPMPANASITRRASPTAIGACDSAWISATPSR